MVSCSLFFIELRAIRAVIKCNAVVKSNRAQARAIGKSAVISVGADAH